jgi:putative MATE family efflux protein
MERWNNRALWLLIWPLMIEQLLAVTVGIADTAMVATVGEAAVSGVSLVDSINTLLIQVFTAMATGGAVVASQYLGRRESDKASLASRQLVYTILAVCLGVMALALSLRTPLLRLIYGHIEAEVMQAAQTYFWLSAVSYPFLGLYNAGAALFRSMGNSRVSMLIALMINLLNIGGNALFIYGFGMGVAGAALSTLISRAVAGIVIIALLLRKNMKPISLRGLFCFQLDFSMVKSILKIGVPNGLENSMFHIGKILVARIVSMFGTAAIAGNAIAMVLATIGNIPGGAIGLALITVVGQCVGGKDYPGARKYTKKLMLVAHLAMAATDVLMVVFAQPILGFFGLSAEATSLAFWCVVIHCGTSAFLWPQSFALPSALRAAGDARYTMLVSMFSMWVFRIGFSFLFAYVFNMGLYSVWVAMVLDWVVRGIFFTLRWRDTKWQGKRLVK